MNGFAPQCQDLPSLVSKVVDELAVLPILPSQHLLQLKHWRVNRFCSMSLERGHNLVEDLIKHDNFQNIRTVLHLRKAKSSDFAILIF